MGYTQEQIDAAVALLEKEQEKKAKAEQRKAKLATDAELLTEVGIDNNLVATLIKKNEVKLSESPISAWAGFSLGSVPFDALGVSVKITVTVTKPDMFPALVEDLAVRKVEAEKARQDARKAKKVAEARALLAEEAIRVAS
jgi:hypothetical protein